MRPRRCRPTQRPRRVRCDVMGVAESRVSTTGGNESVLSLGPGPWVGGAG